MEVAVDQVDEGEQNVQHQPDGRARAEAGHQGVVGLRPPLEDEHHQHQGHPHGGHAAQEGQEHMEEGPEGEVAQHTDGIAQEAQSAEGEEGGSRCRQRS